MWWKGLVTTIDVRQADDCIGDGEVRSGLLEVWGTKNWRQGVSGELNTCLLGKELVKVIEQ